LDNTNVSSIDLSTFTSTAQNRARRALIAIKGDFFAYLPTLGNDFIASRGGNPIMVAGKIVGAIGVSGGAGSQDDAVSQAGAAALKLAPFFDRIRRKNVRFGS
jgi:glc operon protein GlcG